MKIRYYVRSVHADLVDASMPGDRPEGTYLPGELRVELYNRAGSFWTGWKGEQPKVGAQVEVEVTDA